MMLRVAGVPVPGPGDVLDAARSVAGWSADALGAAAGVPQRAMALLTDVEQLLARTSQVVDRAEATIERAGDIAAKAEATVSACAEVTEAATMLIEQSRAVTTDAATAVAKAGAATNDATELLATYRPIAQRAAPLAQRFVDELTEEEVHAAIKLIDQLPVLAERMERDILPVLATLEGVGPDVHQLVEVLEEVRQAIHGVPGFRFFRRRGEEAEEAEQAHSSDGEIERT